MSLPPSPGDLHPHLPPYPPPRQGLSLGAGAALGVLIGLGGPVGLAFVAWAAGSSSVSSEVSDLVIGVSITAIIATPVVLLLAGCLLMIPYEARGWGVAGLMASGVWLICSAGVCTLFVFGALATYDNAMMMLL